MKRYKTQIEEKMLVVSERQLKNIPSLLSKINALKNVGSGHDLRRLVKYEKGYTLELVSYYGGPTWSFNFEVENAH